MDHEPQLSIHILTPLSIHWCVYVWDFYTIAQATKQWDYIHTDHTTLQEWININERKLARFLLLLLPWLVCDVPRAPIIDIDFDIPLNQSVGLCVRLIHHCTSNKARRSHPYWAHNTPRMDQHGWNKSGTLLASALVGVWCTMRSNHPYISWNPHQFEQVDDAVALDTVAVLYHVHKPTMLLLMMMIIMI